MNLSPHFTLSELTKSPEAIRLGIDNSPTAKQIEWLRYHCGAVLEPVRALVRERTGKPVFVTISSGFRAAQVNRAIGGSLTSQHMAREREAATDIEVPTVSNLDLARWIADSQIPYDQLILEFHNPAVPDSGWVHVSSREGRPRRQVLHAVRERGTTSYRQGLPGPVPA